MNSQKKSSTKVRAKNAAPTGQRQYSNLLRSQKTALVKAPSKSRASGAYAAYSVDQVSRGNGSRQLMRTGLKSELFSTLPTTTSQEFQLMHRIRINPLSKNTFKWLPTIAQNFESFKFHKLRFRYENRCSSLTSGSVIMSPSYDSADSNSQAATESLLFQNKGTMDFSVWKNGALEVNCAAMNRLYKSHTCMSDERYATSTQDAKTIDPGQVFICLDGVPAATFTGKIFVDYDVEFFEPHAPTEPVNQGGAEIVNQGITVNSSTPFGLLPVIVKQEINPILKSLADLVAEGTQQAPIAGGSLNSSIIGQFVKDYSGLLNIDYDGTGLTSSSLQLGTSPDPARGYAGAVSVPLVAGTFPMMNNPVLPTQARVMYDIAVKAGEYLKFRSPDATTIAGVSARFGGGAIAY